MTSTLAGEHPVLDQPPSPASPPAVPSEADRRSALAWIAGGFTSARMAARAADPRAYDAFRTAPSLIALAGSERITRALAPGDALAARMAARASRRGAVMAELEAEGWTPAAARAALGGGEPWQTPSYCSACHDRHPGSCACACHLPAGAVPVLAEAAVAA